MSPAKAARKASASSAGRSVDLDMPAPEVDISRTKRWMIPKHPDILSHIEVCLLNNQGVLAQQQQKIMGMVEDTMAIVRKIYNAKGGGASAASSRRASNASQDLEGGSVSDGGSADSLQRRAEQMDIGDGKGLGNDQTDNHSVVMDDDPETPSQQQQEDIRYILEVFCDILQGNHRSWVNALAKPTSWSSPDAPGCKNDAAEFRLHLDNSMAATFGDRWTVHELNHKLCGLTIQSFEQIYWQLLLTSNPTPIRAPPPMFPDFGVQSTPAPAALRNKKSQANLAATSFHQGGMMDSPVAGNTSLSPAAAAFHPNPNPAAAFAPNPTTTGSQAGGSQYGGSMRPTPNPRRTSEKSSVSGGAQTAKTASLKRGAPETTTSNEQLEQMVGNPTTPGPQTGSGLSRSNTTKSAKTSRGGHKRGRGGPSGNAGSKA